MSPLSRPTRDPEAPSPTYDQDDVLQWIFAGRLVVALAVYGSALVIGQDWLYAPGGLTGLSVRMVSIAVLVASALVTAWAYWWSRERPGAPSTSFLGGQAAFDILLVSGAVLLTGGRDSVFPPLLYIVLVSGYALVTPLVSGALVAVGTAVAYLAVIGLGYPEQLGAAVFIQIAIFTVVALVSGLIGGQLRQMGERLSSLERELRRLRIGTADILRTIDAAVLTVDHDGRAVYLNPAAATLFRLDPERWIGESIFGELEIRAPGVRAALVETLKDGDGVRAREVEVHDPEGGSLPHSISTALLQRERDPPLATAVLQDLRMARQLEELHLRASRLGVVAELSASLAHEIKNPLASIRSAVEQIADPTTDDEDRATLGRLVVREADRLSRLLGEFNDFARVDVAERRQIDLHRVIGEAVELVAQRPEAHDRAAFEVEVSGGLDDLWGDPDLVHRTLTNLLLNAVQVSDPESSVTVRVVADALSPSVAPAALASGMPVRIRVIDDGPGIEPEDIGRIFDPFYTRRQGGSGMGLAIAHRAIQAHGGALLVSSRPGHGATFVVILPRRQPSARKVFERLGGEERMAELPDRDPPGGSRSTGTAAALDGFEDRLG